MAREGSPPFWGGRASDGNFQAQSRRGVRGATRESIDIHSIRRMGPPPPPESPPWYACQALEALPPWNGGLPSRATRRERVLPDLALAGAQGPLAGEVGPGAGGDKAQSLARHFLDHMGPPPPPESPPWYACLALEALPPGTGEGTGPVPSRARGRLSGETHFVCESQWDPGIGDFFS